jgi:hypothetical protein
MQARMHSGPERIRDCPVPRQEHTISGIINAYPETTQNFDLPTGKAQYHTYL